MMAPFGVRKGQVLVSRQVNTRATFLDAAERLFSERGYEGMRIRDIASAAQANLSALHYYWGNKEALVEELCERRLRPVMQERLRRYALLEGDLPESKTEQITALLRAHLEPFADVLDGPSQEALQNFYTRLAADPAPQVRAIRVNLVEEMSREFVRLLRPMCGHLSDEEFFWRLNSVLGTVLHLQAFTPIVRKYVPLESNASTLKHGVHPTVYLLTTALSAPPVLK